MDGETEKKLLPGDAAVTLGRRGPFHRQQRAGDGRTHGCDSDLLGLVPKEAPVLEARAKIVYDKQHNV